MNIIFVGSTVDTQTLKKLSDASVAGNKMQLGFVQGFIRNGVKTDVISVEPHAMWKCNGKPTAIKSKTLGEQDVVIQTISYINIPVIKQCSICFNLLKQIKRRNISDETILIVYNTMSMFALPVLKIASQYKCKAVAIVADLPIRANKNFLRRLEDKNQEKLIAKFDGLILLTKHIAEDFAPNHPSCVVEAGCSEEDCFSISKKDENHRSKKVIFSGTLNKLAGIELMIGAMQYLEGHDIELHIYGNGPLKKLVEGATVNKNIIYHGCITNEEMLCLQQQADLLVCPRCADEYTTRYTFPSKILEYICAGVPVLANRLMGIPEEYEKYINYSKSEDAKDWASAIVDILENNRELYLEKAQTAKRTVLETKTWRIQCEKVVTFLKTI